MISQINDLAKNNQSLANDVRFEGQTTVNGNSEAASVLGGQNELNKEVMVFLSKLQLGDVLKGQMMMQNGQTLLKLENGMQLAAKFLQHVSVDQLKEFIVVGKDRQHLELQMKPDTLGTDQGGRTLMEQAIRELGLSDNELGKAAIGQFIAKQLPLVKQQFVQMLQLAKHFEMPTETFANLLSKSLPLSHDETKLIADYKEQGTAMIEENLEHLLSGVSDSQKEKMIQLIVKSFSPKAVLASLLNETEGAMSGNEPLAGTEKEGQIENAMSKDQLVPQKAKTEVESTEGKQLQQLQEKIELPETRLQEEQLLFKLLKGKDIKGIKKLLSTLIKEELTVDGKALDSQGEVEKLSKSAALLKKVAENVSQCEMEGVDGTKLQQMQQLAETLDKYNMNAQYYCFPFQINGQESEGELYFFKPKKNKKGQSGGNYIVLALNMPHLNKIEVHVKENAEKVDLILKVREKQIQKLVDEHKDMLKELLEDTPFKLGTVACEVQSNTPVKAVSSQYEALSSVDARV